VDRALERGLEPRVRAVRARDDNLARLRYHSRRSVEIFRIWERVFGGTQRLERVLSAQFANPWGCEQVVDFESASQHADALAVAPYFGYELGDPAGAAGVVRGGLDGVFASLRQDLAANADRLAQLAALARGRHLALVAYEGGQHLAGHGGAENREDLTALFVAANRDRRMQDLYVEDLGNWRRAGGRLFALFSSVSQPSKWGSWGLLDTQGQDPATAPKYQAVLQLLEQFPHGW
jgi:hypothetical protein